MSASKHFIPEDLEVDASNRSFLITGANSGLGKAAAIAIAKRGGTVHLACRNPESGQAAEKEIIDVTGNQKVHFHQLDISEPKSIVQFVRDFQSKNNKLDVLINNAGCMLNTREVTADGFEKNFATNTLGTYILTNELIPLLLKSDKPRVIIVSSGGMLTQSLATYLKDLQFEQMAPFDGTMAYAQNKRQQVTITEQLAKRHPSVHFSSMHPGWADTAAVRTAMPDFYEKMKTRLRTVEEGADTITWLALSEKCLAQPSGLFYQDRKAVSTHLPLAWTKPTPAQEEALMSALDAMYLKFR